MQNSREVMMVNNPDIESNGFQEIEPKTGAENLSLASIQETIWCKPKITVDDLQEFALKNRQRLSEADLDLIQHVSANIATLSPQFSLRHAELKLVFSHPASKIIVFRSSKRICNRFLGVIKPGKGATFVIRRNDCIFSLKKFITEMDFLPYVWFVVWTVAVVAAVYSLWAIFKNLKLKLMLSGCLNTKIGMGLYNPECAAS